MSKIDPRIVLVITDQETNAQIKNLGVGLLELRADLFKKLDPAYIIDQIKHRKLLKTPLLLTLRNQKEEGAVKTFSDELKMRIIAAVLPLVDMIDIELSSPLLKQVVAMARKLKKKIIVSSHYLQGMPRDLESIFKKSLSTRADIVKIAAKANSFDDVMAMLAFTHRHRKFRPITMSLGPLGAISRLVLPAAGSRYTYTFLNKPTASGQVDVMTLKSHMKFYYPVQE
jgi:3-dehydroquinate dehydratase-1